MNRDTQSPAALFSQVEVSPGSIGSSPELDGATEHVRLLRQLVAAQDRQNELLEELVSVVGTSQRQRQTELGQWKQANPKLAKNCRVAAEALSKVQAEFLYTLTQEVAENADSLIEGDFMLGEFIDRFGPRLAHLNGVLQVLSQLSSGTNNNTANAS